MQSLSSLFSWPALVAGAVSLLVAVGLVRTQHWHGHLGMDSTLGVQTHPTPRVGGIAIADGLLAGYALAHPNRQSLLGPLLVCGYTVLEVLFSIWGRRRHMSTCDPDRLHLHSLVKRRLVRRLLPRASSLARNSATGALMWLAALLPAVIALNWPTRTPALVLGFVVCAPLYSAVYARLSQFRGCLTSATMVAKARSEAPSFRGLK